MRVTTAQSREDGSDIECGSEVLSGQTIRSVSPADSLHHAARLLVEHDISAVVVINSNQDLTGILTKRGLARRWLPKVGARARFECRS